jgi:ElaB/YqjD/DUF883 family membrane-anchored ribosome-binding protein
LSISCAAHCIASAQGGIATAVFKKGSTTDTASAVAQARHDLATNLRRMIDEADRLLTSAVDTGDQAFDAAKAQLADHVRKMRNQLESLEDEALHQAKRAARAANHTVHEHPYSAMGVAAAVGLLIGVLVARR